MKKLFVSYAREDHSRAEAIVEFLRGTGFEVFWDQSMPAGVDWSEFLDAELRTAHRLVVLWTSASVGSRWVRTEADEAMQQDKLLPVLLDPVRPPLAFRQIHCFDLVGWLGAGDDPRLARLVNDLRGPEAGQADAPGVLPRPLPTPPPAPAWRRVLALGAAAGALAWLAFAGWQRYASPADGLDVSTPPASSPFGPTVTAAPPPPLPLASGPSPSAAARRCEAIKEQVGLGNPIPEADRAFLKAGCR